MPSVAATGTNGQSSNLVRCTEVGVHVSSVDEPILTVVNLDRLVEVSDVVVNSMYRHSCSDAITSGRFGLVAMLGKLFSGSR